MLVVVGFVEIVVSYENLYAKNLRGGVRRCLAAVTISLTDLTVINTVGKGNLDGSHAHNCDYDVNKPGITGRIESLGLRESG